ncbi:MAG TPA: zinc metalloprotease HtpX [Chloroflexota bacterium]
MQRKQAWYGRDWGLQARMAVTMLLLTALYLIFSLFLFSTTHLGYLLIVIPLAGLFFQYMYSDKLVLSSSGAHIINEQQAPELFGIVQRLAQQADLPMPRIAVIDTPMPNAFATGRNPKRAVVAVTSGLISQLPPAELEAVLAHEMTHIRNRDMLVMTMAGSFAAVAAWILQMSFWFGMGDSRDRRDGGGNFAIFLLVTLAVQLISHMLVLALSRYREYSADRGGAILTGSPEQLQSALLRISGTMQRIPTQDLRQAQPLSALFFAAPKREVVGELFSDHPSVQNRIARLQELERSLARV